MDTTKVFISSTCYDLIDVRSELNQLLSSIGLSPVLSDDPMSEFNDQSNSNSIQVCLDNVKKSDIVLVILSRRYGPSLKNAGFSDFSATHLEYKEAIKNNIPVFFYIRDRLEAEYNIWKSNRDNSENYVKLNWIKESETRLFDFIEEHRRLNASASQSNWVSTFKDSVELKEIVRKDLMKESGKAILQNLVHSGRVAFLVPSIQSWEINEDRRLTMVVNIANVGTSPAIQPSLTLYADHVEECVMFETLIQSERAIVNFSFILSSKDFKKRNPVMLLSALFTTPDGYLICDDTNIELYWDVLGPQTEPETAWSQYSCKRFIHGSNIVLKSGEFDE